MDKLEETARALGRMLKDSEEYKRFLKASDSFAKDKDLKTMLKTLREKERAIEEKMRKGTPVSIVNSAVNQTLSRTIITSGLTFMVVVVLFLLGGPSIHAFALSLMIGILIGTYSSIYVAGSLAVALGLNRSDLLPSVKKDYDAVV